VRHAPLCRMASLNGWWLAVAFQVCLACGGTTRDASGGAGSTGGTSAGGSRQGVPEGGAASGGGPLATGGIPSCTADDGRVPESLKHCLVDADCTMLRFPTCCGASIVLGVSQGHTCTPAPASCSLLPCPEMAYDSAEDGNDESSGRIKLACEMTGDGKSGSCRTRVVVDPDATPCGSRLCWGEFGICVHPSPSLGGPAPPCVAPIDGGACPPGSSMQPTCGGRSGGGCVEQYVPPQPRCISFLSACKNGITCSCLAISARDVCGPSEICQRTEGRRDVYCVNVAP
jgi:hypothetical protein